MHREGEPIAWQVPELSRGPYILLRVLGRMLTIPLLFMGINAGKGDGLPHYIDIGWIEPRPPVRTRVKRIRAGAADQLRVYPVGSKAAWVPPLERRQVWLTADAATTGTDAPLGTFRPIPLTQLAPVGIRLAGTKGAELPFRDLGGG